MVQLKVTASVLLAAAVIAPVVASGFEAEDSLVIRGDDEFESSFARDFDLELEEREFEDDLFKREPRGSRFLKKAFSFGGKVGSSVSPPQTPDETREFNDDLFEYRSEEELHGRPSTRGSGPSTRGRGPSTRGRGPITRRSSPSTVDKNTIKVRISQIRQQIKETHIDYDREKLQERLAKLNRGVLARSLDEMELLERKYYDELD